jgi:hypothetical protein
MLENRRIIHANSREAYQAHPKLQTRTHFQRSELSSEQKTHFSYINTASGGKKYTQQNPSQEKPKKTLRRLLVLGEVRQ